MATIDYKYYDNNDIYDDGSIEDELLQFYQGKNKVDFTRDDIFYLTTSIRENIISWYPFKKDSNILEVGAGLGTISGALCEVAKNVTSVENSKRRANVLYERHKDRDNLEVIVGNFNKIKFNKKYDYIVLIGVFEYSKMFFDSDNGFSIFLQKIKEQLKEDGKIIIAIENRYGIKYWAGNKEDHLGKKYSGLIGYDNEKVRTFGKLELSNLIEANGFKYYKFYYPFPDYKMPQVVYSDNRLPSNYELASLPVYNFSFEDYEFSPREVLKGLRDNGMFGFYANSFIVEISNSNDLSNVSYAKYQPFRNKEYNVFTVITDSKVVYKKALSKDSLEHLENMKSIHDRISSNNILTSKIVRKNDLYFIDYLDGENLENIIINDFENVDKYIDKYYSFVKTFCIKKSLDLINNNKIKKLYSSKDILVLKIGLLDFNFGNVIVHNEKYYLFDQEWETSTDIPIDYVMYYSIKLLFEKMQFIDKKVINNLYKKYGISKKMMSVFDELSYKYFNEEKKVNNDIAFQKLIAHGSIVINNREQCLQNDLDFYKDLLKKTQDGYENEIERLNELLIKQENIINSMQKQENNRFINRLKNKFKK